MPGLQGRCHPRQPPHDAALRPRPGARLHRQARTRQPQPPLQVPLLPCRVLDHHGQATATVTLLL
eukprot:scaffold43311_cov34-Phaeocystis_antarctica.AAC.2